jgi:hypothetical protein
LGTAVPLIVVDMDLGRANRRVIGGWFEIGPSKSRLGLVTGSAKFRMVAFWGFLEKVDNWSLGSRIAGVNETPGIVTSVIPAPRGGMTCFLLGRAL